MRKVLYLLIAGWLMSQPLAAQTEKMVIHLKSGQSVEYGMEEVDNIEIVSNLKKDPNASGVPGTVGEALDLGLSVLWSSHNLGATQPYDLGEKYSWSEPHLDAWGQGWRLPTEEEWRELYNKSNWSWAVFEGVSGRFVTGPNKCTIFIPAAGLNLDENTMVAGCVGIYWTADKLESAPSGIRPSACGIYFDSANIYRMDYKQSHLLSVRLVKDR